MARVTSGVLFYIILNIAPLLNHLLFIPTFGIFLLKMFAILFCLCFRPMKPAAMEGSNPTPLSMASSPLRLLREESMDANGTLSPISSRSNGTDTETETKKKVKKPIEHIHSKTQLIIDALVEGQGFCDCILSFQPVLIRKRIYIVL